MSPQCLEPGHLGTHLQRHRAQTSMNKEGETVTATVTGKPPTSATGRQVSSLAAVSAGSLLGRGRTAWAGLSRAPTLPQAHGRRDPPTHWPTLTGSTLHKAITHSSFLSSESLGGSRCPILQARRLRLSTAKSPPIPRASAS